MQKYSLENGCPKCGTQETDDEYIYTSRVIERKCKKCRFVRIELPLDHEPKY